MMGSDMNGTATKAHACYTAGNYADALFHLSQLTLASSPNAGGGGGAGGGNISNNNLTTNQQSGGTNDSRSGGGGATGDFRTLHNRTLCQHALQGFTDPARLEEALDAIRVQLRRKGKGEDAQDDGEDIVSEEVGGDAAPGCSGGAALAAAGLKDLDADASVLLFNLSALHFQQKQYGAAQAVLEHLFLHIEPVDESLAIHICFLLLDVLCHTARGNLHDQASLSRFAQQSAVVVGFLERSHALNSAAGGGDRCV